MIYTTDDIVSSVKLRTLMPSSQVTFTNANLVTLANEELQLQLVPEILGVRQDFFVKKKTTAFQALVPNYVLPDRAMGNALKQVYYLDANNNRRQIVVTDVDIVRTFISQTGDPEYCYFQGDQIAVVPTPRASSGTLEFWYFQRANQLVLTESVAKITAVATGASTTVFTVDTNLTASITAASTKTDILKANSPFILWAQDVIPTAISSTTITYNNSDVQNEGGTNLPQVNDYISVAQRANIPMIPQEWHPILCEMVAARVLEALGDLQKLQAVNQKLGLMRASAMKMLQNRVEDQPPRIINRSSLVRSSGFGIYRSGFR